jgi:hypothetical protein
MSNKGESVCEAKTVNHIAISVSNLAFGPRLDFAVLDELGYLHFAQTGGNEMRWYQALTSDTQVTRETTTVKKATTTMKKTESGSKERKGGDSPSQLIDVRIKDLGDWRGEMLSRLRSLVKEADPEVVEEWKWRGVPVWYHDGMICTGETYKNVVKMTFAKGASLEDPSGLFNSSLEGNSRRAIDFHEGEKIDEEALKTLVRAAVALNTSKSTAQS